MAIDWDAEIGELLQRLSSAQRELLALLADKRVMIQRRDHTALAELSHREQDLAAQLQACHDRRSHLLGLARAEGIPSGTLAELSAAVDGNSPSSRPAAMDEARQRARLIRHECLTQWVAVQRTVLHLSQMLEIIATGGRQKPTYGNGCDPESSGSLMDQAV